MSLDTLARLSPSSLRALARLLDDSHAAPDAARLLATGAVPDELAHAAAAMVLSLNDSMGAPPIIARALALIAGDRERAAEAAPQIEVVWSGPEGQAPQHRTTQAVVQQMFQTFERSLLLSTYVIDVGDRADELFGDLAARMDRDPRLAVQLFVNVPPPRKGETPEEAVASFRTRFREKVWPGSRLPDVWYDPRAFESGERRAVLHAKCVVADDREAFVTSANFTEAAHGRNVELGVLVRSQSVARAVRKPFEDLIAGGNLRRLQ